MSITTGKSALSAVHAAVYAALSADATLAARAPGGVFDHVPQDPTFPYVRLGGFAEDTDDTGGTQARRVQFVVHGFSTYRGAKEVYAIVDRVIALLRYTALTCVGWTHDDTRHVTSQLDEPELLEDVQLQHAWAEFEVLVQEA